MSEWIVWLPSALLTLVVVALAVAVVRLRRRIVALEQAAHISPGFETVASATPLVEEVAPQPSRNPVTQAYVVTEPRRIEGSLFADLVLRESVVRGVSFVHGVRRALAPETRNRIRFQMRQEVKRSRKQRRADQRAAKRHLADRQREDAA